MDETQKEKITNWYARSDGLSFALAETVLYSLSIGNKPTIGRLEQRMLKIFMLDKYKNPKEIRDLLMELGKLK